MSNEDYLRKSVVFDKKDPGKMELHRWLKQLDHGKFSEETIAYWMQKMKEDRGS